MKVVYFLLVLFTVAKALVTSNNEAFTRGSLMQLHAENRRSFLRFAGATTLVLSVPEAIAEGSKSSTIWLTGKAPKVPDEKPKDKSDTKGTKRDPSFLRSISDCKSQCEQSRYGNMAKTKEECLEECQDICCTTYEQCTFAITPR
mmetsp:Transcript_12239/g.17947  ORF Transcript_12239/g.17947 Transcript_12239/m.17947 type:complete len:145 (-) Transcript_12239:2000-2434(-)